MHHTAINTDTGAVRAGDDEHRYRRSRPPLTYVPLHEDPLRRLPQLFAGLAMYGLSLAVLVRASLGVNPWSVLYEGLERHTPLTFGLISAVTGSVVLLLWIPLKQKPTIGTVSNIAILAYASDLGLRLLPQHLGLAARLALLACGVLLNGFAGAVYVGARLGPGPRDGLMTGVSAATGRSIRLTRTLIEITVLSIGWLLGGDVGMGTVLYALAVGPVTQFFLHRLAYRTPCDSVHRSSSDTTETVSSGPSAMSRSASTPAGPAASTESVRSGLSTPMSCGCQ